jgi:hypothetical protein
MYSYSASISPSPQSQLISTNDIMTFEKKNVITLLVVLGVLICGLVYYAIYQYNKNKKLKNIIASRDTTQVNPYNRAAVRNIFTTPS